MDRHLYVAGEEGDPVCVRNDIDGILARHHRRSICPRLRHSAIVPDGEACGRRLSSLQRRPAATLLADPKLLRQRRHGRVARVLSGPLVPGRCGDTDEVVTEEAARTGRGVCSCIWSQRCMLSPICGGRNRKCEGSKGATTHHSRSPGVLFDYLAVGSETAKAENVLTVRPGTPGRI